VPANTNQALCLTAECSWNYHDAVAGLARAKRDGVDVEGIPALAAKAHAALAPVESQPLIDRLTLLGMSMMHGKDAAQVQAWLHETARLLADLPEDILFDAIDECVKEHGRVFAPTVGEIRERADSALRLRQRVASRLQQVADLIASGVDVPAADPVKSWMSPPEPAFREQDRCSPEDAAQILSELGISSTAAATAKRHLGPLGKPTREDYIALGVDPSSLGAAA
jgi:hypothetical protein